MGWPGRKRRFGPLKKKKILLEEKRNEGGHWAL
jgi:hypothetical protein